MKHSPTISFINAVLDWFKLAVNPKLKNYTSYRELGWTCLKYSDIAPTTISLQIFGSPPRFPLLINGIASDSRLHFSASAKELNM